MESYPKDWPDDCPPQDAQEANGKVYRIVKNDPPKSSDFKTWLELGRNVKKTQKKCQAAGVSVFRNKNDVNHQLLLFPDIGKYIAEGDLNSDHGKTKSTKGNQPTHTTWWPFDRIKREELFKVTKK